MSYAPLVVLQKIRKIDVLFVQIKTLLQIVILEIFATQPEL